MYTKIRNFILKNKSLFAVISFLYTPMRELQQHRIRRKLTDNIIATYDEMDMCKNTVFYFGIPEHNNLGDIAQTYCILKWIEENYLYHNILKIRTKAAFDNKLINFIKETWKEGDLIICQSGYCTRYKNLDHLMHKKLAGVFYDKPIVILPQTVNLNNARDVQHTKNVFDKCSKLFFIARDMISFERAKEFVKDRQLGYFPDIVTSLIGRIDIKKNIDRQGVLICVRNDSEKYYTDEEISALKESMMEKLEYVDIRDTNSIYSVEYTYSHLDTVIKEMIYDFSKYRVIITDRYHGTIFSLIANTPVIVIKTNDHKVTSGVDWFKDSFDKTAVQLAANLEEAADKAYEVIMQDCKIDNSDYMYQMYYKEKLLNEIKLRQFEV